MVYGNKKYRFPFKNPGDKKRRGRQRGHFTFGLEDLKMSDVKMEGGEASAKRHKSHEAHMVPGLNSRIFGFPNSIITTHKYCDFFTMSSSAGSFVAKYFSANGIFDPDLAVGGHQPLYRDTYASVYNSYAVIGSKIIVRFAHVTGTVGGMIIGIHGDDNDAIGTSVTTIMESNNTVHDLLGLVGGGGVTKTLTSTFEPLRDFGIDTKDDGSSSTAVGANPGQQFVYAIFCQNTETDSSKIAVTIEIQYTVKYSELSTQIQN